MKSIKEFEKTADQMREASGFDGAPVGVRQALLSEGSSDILALLGRVIYLLDRIESAERALRSAKADQIDLLYECRLYAKRAKGADTKSIRETRAARVEERLAMTRAHLSQYGERT